MSIVLKNLLKIGIPVALTAVTYAALKLKEKDFPQKEQPHSDAPIIVALGDSITFGSGVEKTRATDSWESKLEQRLDGSYQVLNYGIPGATLQVQGDCPYWNNLRPGLKGFAQAALALKPEIVILMLGTNDSKPYNWNRKSYEAQLDQRVKEIKSKGSVKRLILMCPPFACPANGEDIVAYDIMNETIRDEIRPIIRRCAQDNEVECIDLYELTKGHPELFSDGVHPNSLGNFIIAKHIYNYLIKQ